MRCCSGIRLSLYKSITYSIRLAATQAAVGSANPENALAVFQNRTDIIAGQTFRFRGGVHIQVRQSFLCYVARILTGLVFDYQALRRAKPEVSRVVTINGIDAFAQPAMWVGQSDSDGPAVHAVCRRSGR